MAKQPELSVSDFFAFGNAAAAHTASLRIPDEAPAAPEASTESEPEIDGRDIGTDLP